MITDNLQFLLESFLTYTEKNPIWILYFVSIIYIIAAAGREGRRIFIYPLAAEALTIFNPLFLGIFIEKFGFGNRFLRFFWMLVFYMVIAYAGVHFLSRFKNKWMQGACFAGILAAVVLAGNPVFADGDLTAYRKTENAQFTHKEIVQLSNVFHSGEKEQPHMLYDGWLLLNYRSYDPDVTSEMTRRLYQKMLKQDLKTFLEGDDSDRIKTIFRVYYYEDYRTPVEEFVSAAKAEEIDYVAVFKGSGLNNYFKKAGMVIVGESDSYNVWEFS